MTNKYKNRFEKRELLKGQKKNETVNPHHKVVGIVVWSGVAGCCSRSDSAPVTRSQFNKF